MSCILQEGLTLKTEGLRCKYVSVEALRELPNLRVLICDRILLSSASRAAAGAMAVSMPKLKFLRSGWLLPESCQQAKPPVDQTLSIDVSSSRKSLIGIRH